MSNGLEIVYQDQYLLVVDKLPGLVVNRAESVREPTLQDQIEKHFPDVFRVPDSGLRNTDFQSRSGVVHRLDRETSGLLLVAKTQKAFENLQKQFKERQIAKEYLALCHGLLEGAGVISSKLARHPKNLSKFTVLPEGREAETRYQLLKYLRLPNEEIERIVSGLKAKNLDYYQKFAYFSYLLLFPKTGRTHQLRVHLKSLQRPITADKLYLGKRLYQFDLNWCPRLFLHAAKLTFSHPVSKETMTLTSDLPNDLKTALNKLVEVK